MLALQMLGMKKMVIVQNKIDRVDAEGAKKNHEAIKTFLSNTIAADAPIIPVSAQHNINIDALIEAIEQNIPTPAEGPLRGSADVRAEELRCQQARHRRLRRSSGASREAASCRGELNVGDEIEISPGLPDERGKYTPLAHQGRQPRHGRGYGGEGGPGRA